MRPTRVGTVPEQGYRPRFLRRVLGGRRAALPSWSLVVWAACVPGKVPSDHAAEYERAERIRAQLAPLRPLYEKQPEARARDWRATHAEPGQTLEQYLRADPRLPDATRKIIHVQPLGELSPGQHALVTKTAEFLSIAYSLEVRARPPLSLRAVPPHARRIGSGAGEQVLTSYVLTTLLAPQLPADAMAMIAFTAADLWPGDGWSFVFGQATLQKRVGVWSLARMGNADGTAGEFRHALLRTLKIAVHETGHMFTIRHCTAYRCVMAGNNGVAELDRTPLQFCPEDLAKLFWATGNDAFSRLRRMRDFSVREGLNEEADFFARAERTLSEVER
jgi:archaemetzincin